MQTVLGSGVLERKSASPQRRGAAPAAMDIVLHAELVLYEVGIGPNGLMRILGQGLQINVIRTPIVVVAGCPLWTVAVSAAHLDKELLATLHIGVVEVAGARNGETAVPHHEVVELVVAHLGLELMPGVVELVGARAQQIVDHRSDAVARAVAVVRRGGVGHNLLQHALVLRHRLGPGVGGVEVSTVRTGDIRDVPHGIGTWSVLQRGAGEGVGVALERLGHLVAFGVGTGHFKRVPGSGCHVVGPLVPKVRVQLHAERCFLPILCDDGVLRNGIDEPRANDADGRLQAHGIVGGLRVGVEGTLRNGHFGIDEVVGLAVGELHGQSRLHGGDVFPVYLDLTAVDRGKEGRAGEGLRHASHLRDVGTVVAALGIWMVDSQEITVAISRGIGVLPLAVAVARVAVDARRAQIGRSESFEGSRVVGEVALKDSFAELESQCQLFATLHHGCLVFVATGGDVTGGTEFAARIPFVGREVAHCLSYIFSVFHIALPADIRVIILAGRKPHDHQSGKE